VDGRQTNVRFLFLNMVKTRRIRDPIHDLIVFEERDELDQLAWKLLETPEFQRLRRIKQLGLSEFVYPGATHSRFSHSVGVFHLARRLVSLIEREINAGRAPGEVDHHRAKVAVLAALLHDLGHGPFSHAFEEAQKSISEKRQAKSKKHEIWTGEIINNTNGRIFEILECEESGLANEIADLIQAETPGDMYHAIVSSSFDADRLDYVQRDRYMTGTGSAAIDLTWLLDNVQVALIDVSPSGDGSDPIYTHSFCLSYRAREAAEDFLLARYRLYSTVYFHRVTRGLEHMLSAIFRAIADSIEAGDNSGLGLGEGHPLVTTLSSGRETLEAYLNLDDAIVWDVIERLSMAQDRRIADIAKRLRRREKPYSIDIQVEFPDDPERQRRARHRLDNEFQEEMGDSVFRDETKLTLYGEIGADDAQAQKRLMIRLHNEETREITNFRDAMVTGSERKREFLRYYFLSESDHRKACEALETIKGGA
jgi:HD superfamily phosphohydrolase